MARQQTEAMPKGNGLERTFEKFARWAARMTGRPITFCAALGVVIVWAVTGPVFHFSDTWQLVINTGTTIITFLMVFLIQQSQNRDTLALQVKLAELVIAAKGAKNALAVAEDLSEEELEALHAHYCERANEIAELKDRTRKDPPKRGA
jgi:low affinity Fe/Cu permease